jgi:hypothetical protein
MLKWLLSGKLKKVIENDVLDARIMLSTMKLKLHKEGAEATFLYAEGVGEVAGLLAKRFGISVPAALVARGLNAQQLSDASHDLSGAIEHARSLFKSESQAARTFGHKHGFGSVVLYHLYRLSFLSTQAPEDQRAEVVAQAERIADFARLMAEIAVGLHDPTEAYS